jgi:RND family efflux transporter MFP subunit
MSKTTYLCLLPLLFAAACSREKKVEAVGGAAAAPTVAVAKAGMEELTRGVSMTGEFKPFQEVDVMAKVAGYVKKIYVDVGDRVSQGQLLATLEVPEMTDDLTRAAASLERSLAEVRRAREELQRTQSAHEMSHLSYTRLASVMKDRPGLVAQAEVDDAHSRDLVSEAQVAAARSGLAAVEQQVNVSKAEQAKVKTLFAYSNVTAPFAGVVTKRFADTGSMIQAGTSSQTQAMPLVRISENRLLRLTLPVPESVVPKVHVGQTVEVKVPALGRTFPGRVARFADRVATDTRTMSTEVDVQNSSMLLVPGMYAEVNLTLEQKDKALAVPIAAVEAGGKVYLVTPQNRVEVRAVTTGLETADRAEIRSGLRPGELVVIGSRSQLKPGQEVRPKLTELTALKAE